MTVRLPWPDNEFSAVSCNCLYCVAEAERAVAEMYRVLHPRGRLVLATDFHADPAAARQQEPTTPAPPSPPRSSPGSRRARQARHGPTQRIRTWPHASCRTYDDECACWHPHRYAQAQRPHFGYERKSKRPGGLATRSASSPDPAYLPDRLPPRPQRADHPLPSDQCPRHRWMSRRSERRIRAHRSPR